jgi:hypothetical protein
MHQAQDVSSHYNKAYRWYSFHGKHPKNWLPGHGHSLIDGQNPDADYLAWKRAEKMTKFH